MSFRAWLSVVTLIFIAVIIYFSRHELEHAWQLLSHVNIWILLLLIPGQILVYYAGGEMMFSYLRAKKSIEHVSGFTQARMALEMNFVNHVLPSGGVSGISYMTWRLSKYGVSAGRGTMAQVVRIAMGIAALIVLIALSVIVVTIDGNINRWMILMSSALVSGMVVAVLICVYLISSKKRMDVFGDWLVRFVNHIVYKVTFGRKRRLLNRRTVEGFFTEIHRDYIALRHDKRILLKPFLWGLLFTTADVGLFIITFWALGEPVNPAPVLIGYGIASLAGFFVITPGGAGAYEAIMVAFLAVAGLSQGVAIAGIVLTRVIILLGTIGLGTYFINWRLSNMANENLLFSVSDFIALTNQTLEYAYPSVEVEGEIASFKVNQGKFVFFDIKDAGGSVGCFMMVWQLRVPIEDGMKVVVTATPKLTPWGKFSLTVRAIRPSGEGSLKKSFELLRAKLNKEGLFAPERKRQLPALPRHVAVISSTQAAGYADFIKILNDRWGGLQVDVAQVQVQGGDAPDQIIRALNYFNSREDLPEVIVLIRGGGSADDLSAFNDELLVREIATSRVPTLVGVGHEVDVSLADMAADVRAATPSNAAQLLVPDRQEIIRSVRRQVQTLLPRTEQAIERGRQEVRQQLERSLVAIGRRYDYQEGQLEGLRRVLAELDPRKVLARGYALMRGVPEIGAMIEIEKSDILLSAEVKRVNKK